MRASSINFHAGEILAWKKDGVRYAILKKDGIFVDQLGRRIDSSLTVKAAIEAAMR